ncbi:hypothetical protein ABH931_000461 [Streptacidiphilus sp. MAP12-33]|uniref:hypothetical protein n=1 Tax=Streptacidiphilus sp. MAP12-33 TaxID=3156266 RepID=UPI003514BC07
MENEPPVQSPAELLAATRAVGRLALAARRGFWFPLVLFGLLVIGAAPWYPVATCDPHGAGICVLAGSPTPSSLSVSLYWLVAGAIGYATTLGYYRLHFVRVGVAGRIWPYVTAGFALFALTLLATPEVSHLLLGRGWTLPGDLAIRGLTPLLPLALGLFVLARLERSLPLAGFAALFLVVALLSNLYDLENQSPLLGWTPSAQWHLLPNLWLSGFTLLLGGLGFGLARQLRDRSVLPQARTA